jgi:FkbM family methyltransferase
MPGRAYHIRGLCKAVGLAKAGEILLRRAFGLSHPVSVYVKGHKLRVRPVDSDLFVLSQVFGWEEYKMDVDHLLMLRKIASDWEAAGIKPLIIDAGANVGYAARYFANLFPNAFIVAIEPDRASFDILAHHTASDLEIKLVYAALWQHDLGVKLQMSCNGSWGSHVTEGSGTPSIRLDTLIASIPNSRPLIIKLDIEGAEREVVESCPNTFAEAKCILIEPHDFKNLGAACLSPLYKVAAARQFDTIIRGENLFLFAVN